MSNWMFAEKETEMLLQCQVEFSISPSYQQKTYGSYGEYLFKSSRTFQLTAITNSFLTNHKYFFPVLFNLKS